VTLPVVSYLIVAYKSYAAIKALVESIVAQNGDSAKEIIVIDNYAPENCVEIVKRFAPTANVVVNPSNCGYTHGINQGIALSGGDYVFLLNPDVVLFPDCTAILLSALRGDPGLAAAAPQLLNADSSIQNSVRNFPTFVTLIYEHLGLASFFPHSRRFGHWRNHYFDHNTRTLVSQPMASALLIRSSVLKSVGDWDERFFIFFSDVDYCRRIQNAGHHILFEPCAKAYHQVGASTRQEGAWLIYDSHRGFYRYLVKHELKGVKALLRPIAATMLAVSAWLRVMFRRLRRLRKTSAT
jgi:hypothetical protein